MNFQVLVDFLCMSVPYLYLLLLDVYGYHFESQLLWFIRCIVLWQEKYAAPATEISVERIRN